MRADMVSFQWAHSVTRNTLPPCSISAYVCVKQAHEAQWHALFSKRHKQHRGHPDSVHPVSLPPPSSSPLSFFFIILPPFSLFSSLSITPVALPWHGTLSFNVCALKQNIKRQHQFKMSSDCGSDSLGFVVACTLLHVAWRRLFLVYIHFFSYIFGQFPLFFALIILFVYGRKTEELFMKK